MIPDVTIAVHVVVRPEGHVHGPGDTISEFLVRQKIPHLLIMHPLDGSAPSMARTVDVDGRATERTIGGAIRGPLPWRALVECLRTVRAVLALRQPLAAYVGIDPVNAWAGIWLRRLGRARQLVFYSADYAVQRYANRALDALYHFIDRLSAQQADVIWNVSGRIIDVRQHHGISPDKLRFVPNAPSLRVIPDVPAAPHHRHEIISMATTTDALENRLLIEAAAVLATQIPTLRIRILGAAASNAFRDVVEAHRMGDRVEVTGLQPQPEVLKLLSHAAVGVALYTSTQPWTAFGDAKKVREYLACGLPVIMTGVPATADEVREAGAGFVIALQRDALVDALRQLLLDDALYARCRTAALGLALSRDSDRVLRREFLELGVLRE